MYRIFLFELATGDGLVPIPFKVTWDVGVEAGRIRLEYGEIYSEVVLPEVTPKWLNASVVFTRIGSYVGRLYIEG